MRRGDIWAGGSVAAVGAVCGWAARRLELWSDYGPGPGFFPVILAVALFLGGAFIVVMGWRAHGKLDELRPSYRRPGIVIALTAAYLGLLHVAGFLAATALFLFVLLYWVESRPVGQSLGLAAGITAAVHVIFAVLLRTPLPAGML